MKPILTKDHAEVIGALWTGMDDHTKESIFASIAHALNARPGPEGYAELSYEEVCRAAWCLGFHYAMCAMEQGALIKVGKVNKEN